MSKFKSKKVISMGDLFEIKSLLIHLYNEYGYTIWFLDNNNNIVTMNDYACNEPRWSFCIHTKEEMIKEAEFLINDGKEIAYLDKRFEWLYIYQKHIKE